MLQPGAIVMVISSDYGWAGKWGKVVSHRDRDYLVEIAGEKNRQVMFKRRELREFVLYEKGTIVTICAAKSDFDGVQGQIVSWDQENKLYVIKVHPKYDYLIGFCLEEEDKYVRFEFTDLERDDDWSSENKAYLLFGRHMMHSLQTYKQKFVPGSECCHQGCRRNATKRIMVNVWGTVLEADVCDKHALEYHGKCIDGPFPNKPPRLEKTG